MLKSASRINAKKTWFQHSILSMTKIIALQFINACLLDTTISRESFASDINYAVYFRIYSLYLCMSCTKNISHMIKPVFWDEEIVVVNAFSWRSSHFKQRYSIVESLAECETIRGPLQVFLLKKSLAVRYLKPELNHGWKASRELTALEEFITIYVTSYQVTACYLRYTFACHVIKHYDWWWSNRWK